MHYGLCSNYPYPRGLDFAPRFFGDTTRFLSYWEGVFVPNPPNFAWYDQIIARMALNGQRAIFGIARNKPVNPLDIRRAVSYTAARYHNDDRVRALEIWNEPNLQAFGAYSPTSYAAIFRTAYAAAKDAGWSKPVLIAGPSPVSGWEEYLKGVFRAGVPDQADLALHPYPRRGVGIVESVREQIYLARKVLRNRSGHGRIWVTEVGVSTADYSPFVQSEKLTQVVKLGREEQLQSMTIFRAADPSPAPNPWEGGLGIMRSDWSPKPAYYALKEVA